MKRIMTLAFALFLPAIATADSFIVDKGEPSAEIIIAENPQRTVHLAARDLQIYIEKITGAKLGITTKPTGQRIKIYVGESTHTQNLGISTDELEYGAYRIVSGEDWLVLIGQDSDFTPNEPWPRNNNDIVSGKMQAAWDKITGKQWGYMHGQLHKHYSGPNSLFGTADERKTDEEGNVHVWTYDERGSFNAVCGFLRDLGVRWYMPGEIGEIVPERKSIALPKIDKTVRPDFPMRILNFRTAVYGRDVMMWGFRLGVRQPYGRQAAHGLHGMTDNQRTLENHPEWFALYGGKRHNHPNVKNNQLCYSNEELFREAVEFARVQLDHFKMDVVSIMPPDGYTAICQCEKCEGKESPELGARGRLSNYVWDFVNRVAKEVGKTHPDKKISNCAYGIYTEPPSNIDKLAPNVQVIIVGGRRPTSAYREDLRRLRMAWQKKTDNPIEIFENYPFTGRGFYLPAYIPRVLGESINETKGQSRGEDIWFTMDFKENAVGYNHFLAHFTARMYWDGKEQDAEALFDEYVKKFYGLAAPAMATFFAYCEQHWREMEKDGDRAAHALELFAAAQSAVASDSVYGRRIQLIDNYLNGLRNKARQLAQRRGPVPKLRLVSGVEQRGKIVVDGKLDDGPWVKIPTASVGRLRELQTGQLPTYGTRFMAEWVGSDLYFAIRCEDHPREKLNIATDKGRQIRQSGTATLSRSNSPPMRTATTNLPSTRPARWSISIAAHHETNGSTGRRKRKSQRKLPTVTGRSKLEYRSLKTRTILLHQVIGRKPTQSLPWHINVCRQRIRDNGSEYSAFSPTGTSGFHVPMKFAHFYSGRSHQFEADASVTDYVIASRAAEALVHDRKWKEAFAAFLALATAEKRTHLQKSVAFQRAARCAVNFKDFERANELTDKIPMEAVAKTTRMEILSAQRRWADIIAECGAEDLTKWAFQQIGEGAFARGRAFYFTKKAEQADEDFQLALAYEPDTRVRLAIRTMMAHNREMHLGDDTGALNLYRKNFVDKGRIGGADEFRSVDRAAAILAKQGKVDEALAAFEVVDFENQKGFWLHEMLLSKAKTMAAAGKKDAAKELFRRVAEDDSASAAHQKQAQEALAK